MTTEKKYILEEGRKGRRERRREEVPMVSKVGWAHNIQREREKKKAC